jgi:transposase
MRYGMMSNFRRSWSKVGIRATLDQQQAFTNSYLFSAVAPLTGESFHLLGFADMNTQSELIFLQELKKQHPTQHVVVVIDNAPCHRPKVLHAIEGLSIIYLPSYSPELNPIERFFEEMRKSTANEIFKGLDAIEERLTKAVKELSDDTKAMKQLLGYEWIKEQCVVVS